MYLRITDNSSLLNLRLISQCFILVASLLTTSLLGHGGGHPSRFIASDGVDNGDCLNPNAPCKTITYVVNLASKGDTIRIAEGEYQSTGTDVFYLLSGLVEVEAGYSRQDNFQKRDISKHKTTFFGVPPEYREKVQAMGFQAIRDSKPTDIKLSAEELEMIASFEMLNNNSQAFSPCRNGRANEFECNRIDLVARMPNSSLHSSNPSLNDIWGLVDLNDNREYAIVGLTNGTSVVDVTDAENPSLVGHIPGFGSTWRDVKTYQYFDSADNEYKAYAYVTTEANQGLQIIDLTDLPNSIALAATINDFSTAHNIYIGNVDYSTGMALPDQEAVIYIAGSSRNGGAYRVYDLVDPTAPSLVSRAPLGTGYVHDLTTMIITDDRTSQCAFQHNPCEVLIDFNENAVEIWDMTNKDSPFRISSTSYSNLGYTHSGWYSDDKMFVFIQDELDEQNFGGNTVLRTMDISDLTAPFISNVYTGPTQAIDHNGFTLGNYYYMSNYRRGLTVLDVTDANDPQELGFFDTYPTPSANTASFSGAWGTYPYLPSGHVLISDSSYGLFIVSVNLPNSVGVVGVNESSIVTEEVASTVTIEVSRTGSTSGQISVDYATVDGTAVAGSDYEPTSGTLSWADGDNESKLISVTILDDEIEELDEMFTLELTDFSDDDAQGASVTTVTITANDGPISVGIIGLNPLEVTTSEANSTIEIEVIRSNSITGEVSVDYSTRDDTAEAGSDYEATSGTLTWTDGDSFTKTISVNILEDDIEETDERFTIELSNFSDAEAQGSSITTVTISANDTAPAPQPTPTPPANNSGGATEMGLLLLLLLLLFYKQSSIHYTLERRKM